MRESAGLLGGEPGVVSLGTWASAVRWCDVLLEGRDPAVRYAAALAPLLGGRSPEQRWADRLPSLSGATAATSREERQHLRMSALFVTRAVARDATDPTIRLVLAGIERRLLEVRPPVSAFEGALHGWTQAVASASATMDPAAAVAVSATQRALLRRGCELLEAFEVVDGVGHGRLQAAVQLNRRQWSKAHETWRQLTARRASPLSETIGKATDDLSLAMTRASGEDVLRGFLATGFGGSFAAALAVTPPGLRADSALVFSGRAVESRSDLASVIRPRSEPEVETPTATTPAVGTAPAMVFVGIAALAESSRPSLRPVADLERVEIRDTAGMERLARQRDIGQLAGAALAGVNDAADLVKGVGNDELQELVERGRKACGSLAVSALPIAHYFARKVYSSERSEFVSAASERLLGLATYWDPSLAKWSTFAYASLDFLHQNTNRRLGRRREVVSDQVVELAEPGSVVGSVVRSVESQVLDGMEREQLRGLLGKLPDWMRNVVESRLSGEATWADIGAQVGQSASTAMRHERTAHGMLRQLYADSQSKPAADVTLRYLALALKPRPSTPPMALPQGGQPASDKGLSAPPR